MKAAGTALLVGALGLDQTAVAQVMLSQPLVGGAIIGWFAGEPETGLFAGAFFQFLCLAELPVGASVPPDSVLAALIGVASFIALGHPAGWSDQALLGLLACAFLPLAALARVADVRVRRANELWMRLTVKLLEDGRLRLAQVAAAGGILFFFLRAFALALAVLVAVTLWGGDGLGRLSRAAPVFVVFARCVPLIGLAVLVAQRRRAGWQVALAAGLAAGVLFSRVRI